MYIECFANHTPILFIGNKDLWRCINGGGGYN